MRIRFAMPFVIAGTLVCAATLMSAALTVSAFTDRAALALGPDGIGTNGPFDIVTVLPDGLVHQGVPGAPAVLPIPGGGAFVPGRAITVAVAVANNTRDLAAAVTMTIAPSDAGGTGQVGSAPNITPFIRVTVVDADTQQLLLGGSATDPGHGVPIGSAAAALGRLGPRSAPPLSDGDPWIAGAGGSRRDLAVTLYFIDTPETNAFNGGQTGLEIEFDGASTP